MREIPVTGPCVYCTRPAIARRYSVKWCAECFGVSHGTAPASEFGCGHDGPIHKFWSARLIGTLCFYDDPRFRRLYRHLMDLHGYEIDGNNFPANGSVLADMIRWVIEDSELFSTDSLIDWDAK